MCDSRVCSVIRAFQQVFWMFKTTTLRWAEYLASLMFGENLT
jgi:hypothetical protein